MGKRIFFDRFGAYIGSEETEKEEVKTCKCAGRWPHLCDTCVEQEEQDGQASADESRSQ